ncbi:MAG: TlpA family protein disulfide reductase [Treponema sp.]|jgi:thiol-disulfide isomerase/thioredoxin|nr:TlpA family protein disulfide reductase [Treponema sp.]
MDKKIKSGLGVFGLILLFAAAAFAYNALGGQAKQNDVPARGQNDPNGTDRQKAPDFAMLDQNGNSVTLSEIIAGGRPVVMNFWASWCPPCKVEMPDFNRVFLEMGGEIQFMMVDLTDGQRETVQAATRYVKDNNFSFPVYFDTRQEGAYRYGITAIPTTLFINKEGYIVTGTRGAIDETALRRGIALLR